MTSRRLSTGSDGISSLGIGGVVAAALVRVVQGVTVGPRYVIAKVTKLLLLLHLTYLVYYRAFDYTNENHQGGITSSDAATQGLNMKRAMILGQAALGVPMWRCDEET
ncbi:hypothetical protein VC83_08037 [Pseudogymnoascus destructans]|uniref:Uncharacterized protein n=1 Tax=Pseudogymnoascus destructans TaxID=655981 RepID=A0A177A3M7_9PEZI|nr:uncharacterized protein VC83_08037 [Pseudogymnoascus destructans]OAF55861.1 hypothetical protein VC83_08037 [Pseudogymnoascus destructans]